MVVSSYRLFIPNELDNRWLETTTPSAPAKERGHFLMAQPPLLREGGDYACIHFFSNLDSCACIRRGARTRLSLLENPDLVLDIKTVFI